MCGCVSWWYCYYLVVVVVVSFLRVTLCVVLCRHACWCCWDASVVVPLSRSSARSAWLHTFVGQGLAGNKRRTSPGDVIVTDACAFKTMLKICGVPSFWRYERTTQWTIRNLVNLSVFCVHFDDTVRLLTTLEGDRMNKKLEITSNLEFVSLDRRSSDGYKRGCAYLRRQ